MIPKHPQRIGRYEILYEIEQGGMSTVYFAYDPIFGRHVAIKILPQALNDPDSRARFERETRIIATIEHPAIVPVYDFGEDEGHLYLVMRFMKGGSLGHRLRDKIFSLYEAYDLLIGIAPAIDKVHKFGIVHQDLKPDNILFDEDDNPFIADFGIARLFEGGGVISGDGILGTLSYASPEQLLQGPNPNPQSDIYALGVILFEMLTGEVLYRGETTMQLIRAILSAPVPKASELNPTLPVVIDALIARAVAKNPTHRYPSATEFAHTLKYALYSLPKESAEGKSEVAFISLPHSLRTTSRLDHAPTLQVSAPPTREGGRKSITYRSIPIGIWGIIAYFLMIAFSTNASNVISSLAQEGQIPSFLLTSTSTSPAANSFVNATIPPLLTIVQTQSPTPTLLAKPTHTQQALVQNEPQSLPVLQLPTQTFTPRVDGQEASPTHVPTTTSLPQPTFTPTPKPTKVKAQPFTYTPTIFIPTIAPP